MVMQLAGEKRHESQDNGEVLTTKIVPTALTTSSGEEIWFEFRRQCFIFSEQLNKFCKLDYPSKEAFVVYSRSTGYGSEAKSQAALEKWGRNVWVFCPYLTVQTYSCFLLAVAFENTIDTCTNMPVQDSKNGLFLGVSWIEISHTKDFATWFWDAFCLTYLLRTILCCLFVCIPSVYLLSPDFFFLFFLFVGLNFPNLHLQDWWRSTAWSRFLSFRSDKGSFALCSSLYSILGWLKIASMGKLWVLMIISFHFWLSLSSPWSLFCLPARVLIALCDILILITWE